jgi:hypothetical protein
MIWKLNVMPDNHSHIIIYLLLFWLFTGTCGPGQDVDKLKSKVDSLESKVNSLEIKCTSH